MKELVLDYSKWRCGENGKVGVNALGKGNTYLRNEQGFECCLGQFIKQLANVEDKDITGYGSPSGLPLTEEDAPLLLTENMIGTCSNSVFSCKAISINDTSLTTIEEKIKELTELCNDYEYELKVINKPE